MAEIYVHNIIQAEISKQIKQTMLMANVKKLYFQKFPVAYVVKAKYGKMSTFVSFILQFLTTVMF